MVRGLSHRPGLVIPVSCLLFGLAGVLMQMQEEIIAFVPVLLLLSRRLGYDRLTAVGMSLGASAVGAAFSPINPFQVGIAQKVAGLPLLSGSGFRLAFLVPAVAIWAFFLYRHAAGVRVAPAAEAPGSASAGGRRLDLILLLVLATFATLRLRGEGARVGLRSVGGALLRHGSPGRASSAGSASRGRPRHSATASAKWRWPRCSSASPAASSW